MSRKITSLITAIVISIVSNLALANVLNDWNFCLSPYLGIDAQLRSTGYETGFGDNLYSKSFPQCNFFAGLKFCDYLGVELGYETTKKQNRTVDLPVGSNILGREVVFASSWSTSVQLKGWNINLIGFLPVHDSYPVSFFGTVGMALLKGNVNAIMTQAFDMPMFVSLNASQTRPVLRLTTGIQYMFLEYFGFRGSICWENTSRLGNFKEPFATERVIAKFNNSLNYGLGLFLQF